MLGGGPVQLGLTTGLAYGGYARSALTIPARLVLNVMPRGLGVLGSFYGGYRFGGSEPAPDGTSAWGASLDVMLGGALSLAPGVGWDRQDGLDVWTLRLGVGLAAVKK